MSRSLAVICALGVLRATTQAQEESAELREIRGLRQKIEEQSGQIEALRQEVAKLAQTLETPKLQAAPAVPVPPAETSGTAAAPEVPKAEALGKHVVAKGETLTSIAKQHNITIADLQKVNKIENDRKLQIGQTLVIPPSKTPEALTEKKEHP